jgi:hypothetical protein
MCDCEINWPDDVPHLIDVDIDRYPSTKKEAQDLEAQGVYFRDSLSLILDTFEDIRARAIVLNLFQNRLVWESLLARGAWIGWIDAWNEVMNILGYTEVYDVE